MLVWITKRSWIITIIISYFLTISKVFYLYPPEKNHFQIRSCFLSTKFEGSTRRGGRECAGNSVFGYNFASAEPAGRKPAKRTSNITSPCRLKTNPTIKPSNLNRSLSQPKFNRKKRVELTAVRFLSVPKEKPEPKQSVEET